MPYISLHICVVVYAQTIRDLVDFQGSFLAIYHVFPVCFYCVGNCQMKSRYTKGFYSYVSMG